MLASPNQLGGAMYVNQGSLRVEDAAALGDFGEFAGTYVLDGAARWQWQHAIPPGRAERYSITFRTLRRNDGPP